MPLGEGQVEELNLSHALKTGLAWTEKAEKGKDRECIFIGGNDKFKGLVGEKAKVCLRNKLWT